MSDGRIRVGVVFGGPSAEHHVSGASALAVVRGLPAHRFRAVVIGVGSDGRWRLLPAVAVEEAAARRTGGLAIQDRFTAEGTEVELQHGGRLVTSDAPETVVEQLDVVFPVMHRPYGEDGVLQGQLEALGVPCVGCGVLASAVGMDKVAMRRAFAAGGIPCVPGVWFTERQWRTREDPLAVADGLPRPRFVKPARAGYGPQLLGFTGSGAGHRLRACHCLGAPLARLEGQSARGHLLHRFSDIALDANPGLPWRHGTLTQSLHPLSVRIAGPDQ